MAMSNIRLVFLSTGKVSTSTSYDPFTAIDLENLSKATGFVLTPTDEYNAYKTDYSEFITAVANQVAALPSGKPFYVGLPVINASDSYTYSSDDYDRLKKFIITINGKYASDSRFKGFYFTNERVFGTVSASSPTSNAMVKLMNNLAYVIRNDPNSKIYKEFIWAPYLGFNHTYYTINQNLGIVANRTNIFNTVYLQSGYYFIPDRGKWNASARTGVPAKNLELAVKCARNNKVYNFTANNDQFIISSSEVGGTKTSSTKIAIDMEAEDSLRWKESVFKSYYQEECTSYAPLITSNVCPFIFYAGSHNGIIKASVWKSIQAFYTDGSYKLPSS